MTHLSSITLNFLRDLQENNNREWFQDNKTRFEAAKAEFEAFIDGLIHEIAVFDPAIGQLQAKKCIFRIYRDTRFSKDKTPYKTNFGAHLVGHNAKPHDRAGYYLHVKPGENMLAGGAYMPQGPWMKAIRSEIEHHTQEFKDILQHKDFKQYFGEMEGERLKTAPRDYPKDHPEIELLKYKSFLATHYFGDEMLQKEGFLGHAAKVFKALQPFDLFLNRAMD